MKTKLKTASSEDMRTNPLHGYRIIAFFSIFTALSDISICSTCEQRIHVGESGQRGLGFKIVVMCRCGNREINSGPFNNTGYKINRRIVLVMRLLGVTREGINVFFNLMDICTGLSQFSYTKIGKHIHAAAKSSFEFHSHKAAVKKHGLKSLYGVTTLIGYYSRKVIDLVVKSSYCQGFTSCKNRAHTEKYRKWF